MTKNTLVDLNNHLFAQLERLNDEEIKGDELQEELQRAKVISDVARSIVKNGNLILQAHKFKDESLDLNNQLPEMLENKK
ncbi:TPA: hypothetical protein PQS99_001884 [Staphylococcus aureus]|uniref:Phage protein n=1 Tax=Staphylococcus phage B236 TaxID=1636205 RepID=A0A0E3TAK6_9CAUD|nr:MULTISPECIES: hypothetical protein [Staphylococcus]YP_009209154.1 RNA polymerase beta subunit [Staphylococcus phage B236]MBO0929339.1 hypothetical protein [Staphylococcus sp. 30403_3112M30944]MBO0946938.1 hypothetical protein [Staphylococcus sp. 30402_3112M30943]MBO0965494.1 hypothetical protein [Staphylococcus sp. 30400_3112M30941]MBO0968030.1 hypothetical protein [Staphylococcus sp. 30401_3112M30942]UKM36363.1 hypothetical protein VBSAUS832_35 [Staphylococcus phage vB_SauS_832]UKM36504.